MSQKPNFIYIGTSKAGSTWLFDLLSRHPDVFMTPVKGLYFFDSHFDNGWPWYTQHFAEASGEAVIGEISHSYLYSQIACQRIAEMDPHIRLMVCLREPIDRAFSMYLDGIRNGKWTGSFEERCEDTREILEEGCYARYLQPYMERFPREQIHITLFDDLKQSPQDYAANLFDALGISHLPWDSRLDSKVMPACVPRNERLAHISKRMSEACRRMGWKKLRGRIKRSRMIRSLIYRNVKDEDRATLSDAARAALKQRFQPEVERLEELLGIQLCARWGYAKPSVSTPLESAEVPRT